MDIIRIKGLEIDCIVGVRPHEREREQRVHIDLALGLDLSPAGRSGRIALTCDYDQIAEEIIALLRFRHYHLIEMATEEVAAMLLGVHPALEWVELELDKPAALDGRARAAAVEVRRPRAAFPTESRTTELGSADVLLETREAGLYRLTIAPGVELPSGYARADRELEWSIAGELLVDGEPLRRHEPRFRLEDERRPTCVNAGKREAVLFRCVCPPLTGSL